MKKFVYIKSKRSKRYDGFSVTFQGISFTRDCLKNHFKVKTPRILIKIPSAKNIKDNTYKYANEIYLREVDDTNDRSYKIGVSNTISCSKLSYHVQIGKYIYKETKRNWDIFQKV